MKDASINWIFFDMGGVILNDDKPESLRQAALLEVTQKFIPNITMEDIYNSWLAASQLPGSVRINALREMFKNSAHLEIAEAEYISVCNYNYHALSYIRPDAKEVLTELSKSYNLGIMANQNIKTMTLLETAGLLPYFSHQKMSDHIGLQKPDPNFYLTILQDSGAKPEESIIIDDNWYRGLLPAKNLGMSTVLYERDIIPYPNTAQPNFRVTNLKDLFKIFI